MAKKKITTKMLRDWGACKPGYKWFRKRFGESVDVKTFIGTGIWDGHSDWAEWTVDHLLKRDTEWAQANKPYVFMGRGEDGIWKGFEICKMYEGGYVSHWSMDSTEKKLFEYLRK